MGKQSTSNIGFEKQIWDAACVLRGNLDASEYKSVVLGLIFLKYISDSFEAKYQELLAAGEGDEEDRDEYTYENIFFVPPSSRWSRIAQAAHTPEIGVVIDEAMREIEKETAVMDRSEGGVTFCGGEPLMQPDFLLELLTRCGQEDIHRAVDTTLYASEEIVRRVIPQCDLFLVDLKLMDSEKHRHYCGVPNERVLENLRLVASSDVPYWIRIPLIEGVNADEENIRKSAEFLASLPKPPEMINLLVYHDIGKNKHDKLGTTYNPHQYAMRAPDEATQQRCLDTFSEHRLTAKIGG